MRRDDARAPPDRGGYEVGLPGRGRGDDLLGEAGSEHERLELQPALQQPQQAQRNLQVAAGDTDAVREGERARSGVPFDCSSRVALGRPGSSRERIEVADAYGMEAVLPVFWFQSRRLPISEM